MNTNANYTVHSTAIDHDAGDTLSLIIATRAGAIAMDRLSDREVIELGPEGLWELVQDELQGIVWEIVETATGEQLQGGFTTIEEVEDFADAEVGCDYTVQPEPTAEELRQARRIAGKFPTLTKAREPHVSSYKGLYPLGYWVQLPILSGNRYTGAASVAVEDLRGHWNRPDPVWEVRAPAGFHFADELTHSMLCHTLDDVRERCSFAELVRCFPGCGCGCEVDAELPDEEQALTDEDVAAVFAEIDAAAAATVDEVLDKVFSDSDAEACRRDIVPCARRRASDDNSCEHTASEEGSA